MAVDILTYRADLRPAIVDFWNRNFRDRINFFPMTEDLFQKRIVDRRTAVERFDPDGLLLAVEDGAVAGMIHAGVHSEEFCSAVDPEWRGGDRGYVALLCVDRDRRRRGIGKRLWDRAMLHLAGLSTIVVDGQCLNIFYGNSSAPETPFWGTPEGISIAWGDHETLQFLARRGFQPRFRGAQLLMDLNSLPATVNPAPPSVTLSVLVNAIPSVGDRLENAFLVPPPADFQAFVAVSEGIVVSSLVCYCLTEVPSRPFAIYEMQTHPGHQGKGIGKAVLGAALLDMKRRGGTICHVLTVPNLSPAAVAFYRSAGFTPCAEWAIY